MTTVMMVLWLWGGASQAPVTIDRILAVVDGDPIALSDVRAVRMLALVPPESSDMAIVEALVERRIVLTELRRFRVPEPEPALLAARRSEWLRGLGGRSPEALMAAAGVRVGFVDRWLTDDLRREVYVEQRFAALETSRRADAIRLWIDSLRARANIVYRMQTRP